MIRKNDGRTALTGELGPPTLVNFHELFSRELSSGLKLAQPLGTFFGGCQAGCQDRLKPLETSDVSKRDGN